MPRSWINGEKLLCTRETPQGITADRDKIRALGHWCRRGEFCRDENWSIDRSAHRGDSADLVHGRADNGKVEPLVAANIAEEDVTDMERQVDAGNRMPFFGGMWVQTLNSHS